MAVKVSGRASWYGGKNDSQDNNRPASGIPNEDAPAIALLRPKTLGAIYRVTDRETGESYLAIHGDVGPASWTGMAVDVNPLLAKKFKAGLNGITGRNLTAQLVYRPKNAKEAIQIANSQTLPNGKSYAKTPVAKKAKSAQAGEATTTAQATASDGIQQGLLSALLSGASSRGSLLSEAVSRVGTSAQQAQTPLEQVAEAATGKKTKAKKKASRAPQSTKQLTGVTTFDGKPVARWIAAELQAARKAGWKGSVNSGYRTDAEQVRIWNSGVRPAAKPVSLGGSGSRHNGKAYPNGAVDVTNAAQLSRVLTKMGSKLKWAGSKDPVHFSVPSGGSY